MVSQPNGKKTKIHLSISPELKKWLEEHSWVNASGLLEGAIRKLQGSLEDNDFFEPLR